MKFVSASEAVSFIKDKDMVGISGSGGCGSPESLLEALRERYEKEQRPRKIGVTCGISASDLSEDYVGFNNLAVDGLVGRAICAHLGRGKLFGKAVSENKFPAYTIPLGIYSQLLRCISQRNPGVISRVGLNTYCDPRIEGCAANEKAKKESIVDLVKIDKKDYLFYHSFAVNVALIKASYADKNGNVSLYKEPIIGEQVELSSAVHSCGGIVICEVEEIVDEIVPKKVDIFNKIVDYIVVAKPKSNNTEYNFPVYRPELIGEKKIKLNKLKPIELDERKICGRRASLELKKNDIVNCGIGMPDTIGMIASEEGYADKIIISIETGIFGGVPVYGQLFGSAINPTSLYSTANIFDLYDGGVLDVGVVGLAEVDKYGNVNVSKLSGRTTGAGGFINITQNCKKIIIMGTFTSGGLKVSINDGKLKILEEGKYKKFKKHVSQITLSSKNILYNKQEIKYITERAVFILNKKGLLELTEIAPGISIEKDILPNMDFKPIISKKLKIMDERIFRDKKMGLIELFK